MRASRRKPARPANDPLIESLLDEVLGGTRPPDLRERILLRSEPVGRVTAQPARPPNLPGLVAPPVQESGNGDGVELVFRSEAGGRRVRQRRFRRLTWLVAQSVVLMAGVVLALAALQHVIGWRANDGSDVTVARSSTDDANAETAASTATSESSSDPTSGNEPPAVEPSPAAAVSPELEEDGEATQLADASDAMNQLMPEHAAEWDRERLTVVERIDQYLHHAWEQARVEPSPAIADSEWCVRVYENVLGRKPSAAELAEFDETRPERRREALIDHLYAEPEHRAESAQHWSEIYASQLLRSTRDDTPSAASLRSGLERYLRAALLRNQGFDQIVLELLTAKGSNSVNEKDYHGATNYLLALTDASGARPTVEICRVLLGRRRSVHNAMMIRKVVCGRKTSGSSRHSFVRHTSSRWGRDVSG